MMIPERTASQSNKSARRRMDPGPAPNKEWKRKRRKKRRTTTSNSSSNRLKSPLPLGTPPRNDENGNTNQIEESRLPTTKSASASAADGAKQHHQQQQMAPPLRPATEAAAAAVEQQQRHRHGQKAKEEETEGPSTSSSAFGSSTGDLQLAEASSDLQLPLASKPATDDGINHCSTLAGPSSSCPVVDAAVANGTPPAGADPPNIDGLQSWRATPLLADCQMPSQLLIPAPTVGSKLAAPPPLLAPSLSLRRHHVPLTEANPQKDDLLQPQQHLSASPAGSSLLAPCSASSCSAGSLGSILASNKSRIFPSTRFFIALLLCLCYVSLSISTSNISVSMVCMIRKAASPPAEVPEFNVLAPLEELINAQEREKSDVLLFLRRRRSSSPTSANLTADNSTNKTMNSTAAGQQQRECDWNRVRKHVTEAAGGGEDNSNRSKRLTVLVESCHEAEKLAWGSTDQGIVFAAQNAGSLLMLFTGAHADRLNSKWTIAGALALLVLSNAVLPLVASMSVWLVVVARLMTGLSDALLQPSTSSLITRWFPPKERPFAIGLITGGRQIGTLLILPLAGFLCSRQDIAGGWPAIFYLSSLIGSAILLVWLLMSADKPSKHFCTSRREQSFVEQKIAEERLGKRTERRRIPWRRLATCGPLHVGVAALICHEYPLVIMLQLLPKYINDVLHLSNLTNGIVSALPIAVLFISKTFSASASSYIQARKKGRFLIGRTALAKWFNGVASLGLGLCVGIVPLLNTERWVGAIVVLCLANAFAGLHTPGVQTALLQIAPAYTGIITGIAFGCVAIFGIINKILSNFILQSGSLHEWTIVFWIAAVIALLPVGFFSLWGSAERQPWASTRRPSVLSKKNNAEHGIGSRVFPADSLTGGKDGGIFVIGQQSEKSQETCLDKCGRAEQGRADEDEEEEEDSDSAHFEPEAAVASALRLQMFWGHPGGGAEEEEEEEGDGQFLHDILQAHAQAAWKVNNAVQRQMNGSGREEQQETSSRTTAPAAEDVVPAGIGRATEEKL